MNEDAVEKIKRPLADRLGDERDWKDAVNARLNGNEEKYFILKEQLHGVQDQLDKLTRITAMRLQDEARKEGKHYKPKKRPKKRT
tara:strand:+ start:1036 stop:1290 length:255 start_codon:yes stop_codon:yes gene_type:complete